MSFRKLSAFQPFLKRICRATSARAHWLALGFLLTVGIFSYWNTSTLIETTNSKTQHFLLLNELQSLLATVNDAERGQRGYLLVGEQSYLAPYQNAARVVDQELQRIGQLLKGVPGQKSAFDAMQRLTTMKFVELKETVELRQSAGIEAALQVVRTGRGKKLMSEFRGLVDQITQNVQELLAEQDRQIVALSVRATRWNIAGSVLAAILFVSVIRRELRELTRVEQRARELARATETARIQAVAQSDGRIAALGHRAGALARSVELLRVQAIERSDGKIEALGQQARDLATSVEASRVQASERSDGKIEALGQQARDLATSVEASRILTLKRSDKEIVALGQQARDLATFVETSRIQTLKESTEEIRLNEELEKRVLERTAQLEAANTELDSFCYSVSHDLRAPLRAIDGFSRIVLEEYSAPLAAEGQAYLQLVRENTRQMGQLVDDLLAFARLGRQALVMHTVDAAKMVRRCLEEMTKERQGRQVEIVIGDLPYCRADPKLLKHVWMNLLANALKYTRKREIARIEVGFRTQPRTVVDGRPSAPDSAGPEVIYFVKDNGAGFDMKYVRKLFGVFQRLHRAKDYEGTGVGLAIVQRIVQRHGGRVWGQAICNQGATFSFTLG